MATRALIGKIQGDKVRYIYNQNDGYVEHLGAKLLKHYSDSSKLDNLLELGDINYIESSLQKTKVRLYTSFDKETGERVDNNNPARICDIMDYISQRIDGGESLGIDYFYLWQNGTWYVMADGGRWYAMHNTEHIKELVKLFDK